MNEQVTIDLGDAGSVTITINVNLFETSDDDTAFIIDLLRLIKPRLDRQDAARERVEAERRHLVTANNRGGRA